MDIANSDNITAEEALSYYNTNCADKYTRANIDERLPFILGDAEWLWDKAQASYYEDRSAIDIPLNGGYQYVVYRKQADGTYYGVRTLSRVVAVQDDASGNISFYIRVSIPDKDDINTSTESLNFGDKTNFSGLEYYITINGCPAAMVKFENGEQTDGVFLGDESIDKVARIRKFAELFRGLCIGRVSGTSRTDVNIGKVTGRFYDAVGGCWYSYIDIDGDGKADAITGDFDPVVITPNQSLSANSGNGNGSSGGDGSSGVIGSNTGFDGVGDAGSSISGVEGLNSGIAGGSGGGSGSTQTVGDSNQSKDKEDGFYDFYINLDFDGSIPVNPIKNINKIGTDIIKNENITEPEPEPEPEPKPEPEENINLGDSSKFVAYNTNGQTNCLDLCKAILSKYGITNYGSPNNVFKLMYEVDGVLKHYGDNVQQNYQNAINCINCHLEAGRPIIVGVNHKIGQTINEGVTDHFVVIYGRIYDSKTGYYHYLYYDVCTSHISIGYSDMSNRFIYKNTEPPYLYDDISSRTDKKRYDVIQIRPNDGNLNGTIPQESK